MSRTAYQFGGYADYFQEMERLEQFMGLSPRRATASLSWGNNRASLNPAPDIIRRTESGVRPREERAAFHPRRTNN